MSDRQTSSSFFVLPTIHTPPIDTDGDPTIQLPALNEAELEAIELLSDDDRDAVGSADSELGDRLRMLTAPAPPPEERPSRESAFQRLLTTMATAGQRMVTAPCAAILVLVAGLRRLMPVMRFARGVARACVSTLVDLRSVLGQLPGWFRERGRLGRTRVLRFRLSEAELSIVTAVANRSGCQPCDIVRALLQQQYRDLLARRGDSRTADGPQDDCEMELAGVRRTLVMPPQE